MGCILFTMCALRPPFSNANASAMAQEILKAQVPPLPGKHVEAFGSICSKMMSSDYALRPCAKHILEDVSSRCGTQHSVPQVVLQESACPAVAKVDAAAISSKALNQL